MLKHTILVAAVAGLVLALFAGTANAALLAYESFETEGLGGFDGTADQTWTLGASTEQIVNQDLSYSGGTVTVDDGDRNLRLSGLGSIVSPVADFTFTSQTGPVYFSFLAEVQSGAFFEPWVSGVANHVGGASLAMDAQSGDTVEARLNGGTTPWAKSGDLENAVGGLTFAVGKLFKSGAGNYDRLQMVINPTTTTEPGTWDADLTHANDIGVSSVNRFGLRYGSHQAGWIDEIRIGTTYAAVVPEPATLALLLLGLPFVMRRKRR